jgi:hypothetical protein
VLVSLDVLFYGFYQYYVFYVSQGFSMHSVLEAASFAASAKRIRLKEDERHEITLAIAQNPLLGELIEGTGGARKVRFGKDGRG